MTDRLARTIAEIRAGRVARLTRTELLDLCDAAEAAIVMRGGAPLEHLTDSQINDAIVRERDELLLERNLLLDRLSRARAALDGRP